MTVSYSATLETPIGLIRITATERGVTDIEFTQKAEEMSADAPACLAQCVAQLREYFDGKRRTFDDLPLAVRGTEFQQRVWEETSAIPFNETVTYGAIARSMGMKAGFQAVGAAVGANKICIIIPCHRVMGSDGALTGYAWGIEKKKWLLEHERKWKQYKSITSG